MDCNLYVDEFINIITEDTEKKFVKYLMKHRNKLMN